MTLECRYGFPFYQATTSRRLKGASRENSEEISFNEHAGTRVHNTTDSRKSKNTKPWRYSRRSNLFWVCPSKFRMQVKKPPATSMLILNASLCGLSSTTGCGGSFRLYTHYKQSVIVVVVRLINRKRDLYYPFTSLLNQPSGLAGS
jgi:hypothetical protein